MNTTDLLTVEEAVAYLTITKGSIWRWCRVGKLPCIKMSHLWRIGRKDVEEMIEGAGSEPQHRQNAHI